MKQIFYARLRVLSIAWCTLWTRRWRRCVPSKWQLTSIGPHWVTPLLNHRCENLRPDCSRSNCALMENFCVHIWNHHGPIRINLKSWITITYWTSLTFFLEFSPDVLPSFLPTHCQRSTGIDAIQMIRGCVG
jgi:hypothetical protein